MKAIRRTALILLVSLLGFSVSASTMIFKVTAFEGGPGFKEIQKANYYLALKRTTRGVSAPLSHGFEASGNHCVAQSFSSKPERAVSACNSALRALDSASSSSYYQQTYKVEQNRSALYSNRGVANAVNGDRQAAKRDFERALSLDPYNTQASDNLQHLLNVKSYR
jgi:tetratricopeptide (TPR) repeat protein